MKTLIKFFMIALLSSMTMAWQVVEIDRSYYLSQGGRLIQLSYNGVPKVVNKTSFTQDIEFIDYYSGSFGTSRIIKEYRRIIYSHSKDKVLINAAFKYEAEQVEQPKWIFSKDRASVHIIDDEGSLDTVVKLK